GTSQDRALDFDAGGIQDRSYSIFHLYSCLKELKQGTIVIQDVWATPLDIVTSGCDGGIFGVEFEGAVYYILDIAVMTKELLKLAFEKPVSFHIACFISRLSLKIYYNNISTIMEDVSDIYIDAYDQEGFLHWQR